MRTFLLIGMGHLKMQISVLREIRKLLTGMSLQKTDIYDYRQVRISAEGYGQYIGISKILCAKVIKSRPKK
jgi:hypothetical protein